MAQRLRPKADISIGPWLDSAGESPTELWPMLDETSPVTGDYVYTETAGAFEVAMDAGSVPTAETGHRVWYEVWGDGATNLAGSVYDNSVSPPLLIESWTEQSPPPGAAPTVLYHELSPSNVGTINGASGYAALSVRFEAAAGGGAEITVVQVGGTPSGPGTSGARTFASDVTAGNLLIVVAHAQKQSLDPFVVGDISLSGGTATVGAWSMDIQRQLSTSNNPDVAIFSTIVTGTGSATVTVGGAPADTYFNIAAGEFASSTGWDSSRLEASNSGTGTSTTPASGDATSAAGALFIGGFSGGLISNVTITEDGAFTLIDEEEAGATYLPASAIYQIAGGGTTDAADWTVSSSTSWAAAIAVYKGV